jgi:hypothetical protein
MDSVGKGTRILYTDRTVPLEEPAVSFLRQHNYEVTTVPKDNLQQWLAKNQNDLPEILISDADPEVVKSYRQLGVHPTAIWFTNHPASMAEKAMQYGVRDIIQKYESVSIERYSMRDPQAHVRKVQHHLEHLLKAVRKSEEHLPIGGGPAVVEITGAFYAGKTSLLNLLMFYTGGGNLHRSELRKAFDILPVMTTRDSRPGERSVLEAEKIFDECSRFSDKMCVKGLRSIDVQRPKTSLDYDATAMMNSHHLLPWKSPGGKQCLSLTTREGKRFGTKYLGVPEDVPCLQELCEDGSDRVILWAAADPEAALRFNDHVTLLGYAMQQEKPEFRLAHKWYILNLPLKDALNRYVARPDNHLNMDTGKALRENEQILLYDNDEGRSRAEEMLQRIAKKQKGWETPLANAHGVTANGARLLDLTSRYRRFLDIAKDYPDIATPVNAAGTYKARDIVYKGICQMLQENSESTPRRKGRRGKAAKLQEIPA